MKNKYDKFEYIFNAYANGATSQVKCDVKRLSRSERFDLILYTRTYSLETSDYFMKMCVTGDFK